MLKSINKKFIVSLFSIFILFLASCEDDKATKSEIEEMADYELTFESTWSSETHPMDFPNNPHFSGLIGAVHNENVVFWEKGNLASPGIKEMAETGRKDSLTSEVEKAIKSNNALRVLSGGNIGSSPGSVTISFQVHYDFPLVTIVSMIAPSPDWFVGVSSLNLIENGKWSDKKTIELYVYDAGTDSGDKYVSSNEPTMPPANISKIEDSPFKIDGSIKSVGTFTFTRKF